MILGAYRSLTWLSGPLLERLIKKRLARGKEDPARVNERKGIASAARPKGPVIWIHAASVGEAVSSLPLIDRLLADHPQATILQTTGTVTSAQMMEKRLAHRAIHQFIPLDHPAWVRRFLDHWQPDLALWMESELWPNLLAQTRRRNIPMILVNARLSDRSFRRWQKFPGIADSLLSGFQEIMVQSERDREKFATLGFPRAQHPGNLKFAGLPRSVPGAENSELGLSIAGRPCWLAASTHQGEENIVASAQQRLRKKYPDLLLILAPRHPERGETVKRALIEQGFITAQRSQGETPTHETSIYLADTLGEMDLFYSLSRITAVCGSLIPGIGGHNPLEPARWGNAILFGSHMANCRDLADAMLATKSAVEVKDANQLADALDGYLTAPEKLSIAGSLAAAFVEKEAEVVDRMIKIITPYLPVGASD
ncbi:3-deoxy-D-manno-octulosonic acid transferase [Aestuariispira insulae]|uniref:3-deoxy-D-manno-octulosonic acid transferase n=1 Tax=Aestuariispira insulae TaxID=1461337 RepID=A0A3D9HX29_9PROT|nr:3-deoxy-D-manno-octulosonic acid transferase [Aestuariispira insulae]RED54058.1 3-deoxy-D-manno-octulosonic-acid transferase [Aestuariispira insulae]